MHNEFMEKIRVLMLDGLPRSLDEICDSLDSKDYYSVLLCLRDLKLICNGGYRVKCTRLYTVEAPIPKQPQRPCEYLKRNGFRCKFNGAVEQNGLWVCRRHTQETIDWYASQIAENRRRRLEAKQESERREIQRLKGCPI